MNATHTLLRWISSLNQLLQRLATTLLLPSIVLLVTIDVGIRSMRADTLSWSHELLGLLLLMFFLLGLPYCSQRNDLIRVDLFARYIPASGNLWLQRLSNLLCAVIGGLLAYQAVISGLDMYAYDDAMVTLPIPLWPFAFALSFLAATWAIGQFVQIFAPLNSNEFL